MPPISRSSVIKAHPKTEAPFGQIHNVPGARPLSRCHLPEDFLLLQSSYRTLFLGDSTRTLSAGG